MKRLLVMLSLAAAVVLAGCSKLADEIDPSAKNETGMVKSQSPVPINGTVAGDLTTGGAAVCTAPWMPKYFDGEGNLTHLGNSDGMFDYCIQVTSMSPTADINGYLEGTGMLVAANGDELWGYFSATFKFGGWTQYGPTTNTITCTSGVFYGGTGRFENAVGNFTGIGFVSDLTVYPQPTTFSIEGTVQY